MPNKQFISCLQNFSNIEHIVPVGRASIGIYVALRIWTGGQQTLVALSASVCQDVLVAICMADCTPFFCDIDPTTGHVPIAEWKRARDQGAKVALVAHLYGNPEETSAIRTLFPSPEYLLIDDAAQALGSNIGKYMTGTGGDVGVLSFGVTKHIEVGGGALLFHDESFGMECRHLLKTLTPTPKKERLNLAQNFYTCFQKARKQLINADDISGFLGLLKGYEPILQVIWNHKWEEGILNAFHDWPRRASMRRAKAKTWLKLINGTGLVPLGMDVSDQGGCIPWRFTCRLPGCSWQQQYIFGEYLRGYNLDVSHWYFPGNWFFSSRKGRLIGVECLAREVFQFWVDERTSVNFIEKSNFALRSCFSALS
jgi:hypothetical protein